MLNLILFGPPGAGKGTQAAKLAGAYRLMHISTGDILRYEIARSTPLGLKIRSVINRGELVADAVLIEILQSVIDQHNEVEGFIFDGFPRTIPQAEALGRMLSAEGHTISAVISLEVKKEELIRRLLNRAIETGRSDDTDEVIRKRQEVYAAQTRPLLEYYTKSGLLREVPGMGTVDDIFQKLCAVIDRLK
jgi:adenylate kinase